PRLLRNPCVVCNHTQVGVDCWYPCGTRTPTLICPHHLSLWTWPPTILLPTEPISLPADNLPDRFCCTRTQQRHTAGRCPEYAFQAAQRRRHSARPVRKRPSFAFGTQARQWFS
ncbi:unnamed protein product, partial [Ectocarpus fasciculatus]